MADFTTAARPYARAVYQLAEENSSVDDWGNALALLAAVSADSIMLSIIDDPQMSGEKKGEQLIRVVDDKTNQQQKNLVKLMAENGRLRILPDVAEQFEVYRAEAEGKIDAQVTSAFELSVDQENTIIKTLTDKLGREVSITTSIDESLIGGVVIKAGDTIIDGSMKAQLESLALTLSR
jgi:F-type H+-transporting ATPase subunit delta